MSNNRTVNTEKRPGTSRQEDHQAESTTDTLEGASNMCNSTTLAPSAKEKYGSLTHNLVEVIRTEMRTRNIGRHVLAEKIGRHPETLRLKLKGQRTLYIGEVAAISSALGIKTSELMKAAATRQAGDSR